MNARLKNMTDIPMKYITENTKQIVKEKFYLSVYRYLYKSNGFSQANFFKFQFQVKRYFKI